MPDEVHTRDMGPQDWPEVRRIYEEGIATRNATFEIESPEWEAWDGGHLAEPRLVAAVDDGLVGWCALTPVSSRRVYRGVVEVSTYVGAKARGRGVGRALLTRMIERAERAGIWTLQAGVFPENGPSLLLHARCGFRTVGVRERIGQLDGVWRDVVLLERRTGAVEDHRGESGGEPDERPSFNEGARPPDPEGASAPVPGASPSPGAPG